MGFGRFDPSDGDCMSEGDGREMRGEAGNIAVFPGNRQEERQKDRAPERPPERVAFTRDELQTILNLYGRQVAAGEWRDYAMDFLKDRAVFSIFRRSSEVPIYRIEKTPRLAQKQGAFSVVAATGLILRRGNNLGRVVNVLDRQVKLVT